LKFAHCGAYGVMTASWGVSAAAATTWALPATLRAISHERLWWGTQMHLRGLLKNTSDVQPTTVQVCIQATHGEHGEHGITETLDVASLIATRSGDVRRPIQCRSAGADDTMFTLARRYGSVKTRHRKMRKAQAQPSGAANS
jgi:hypothetical protein